MVCAPGRAHNRLTPSNGDDLLFDHVLWAERAKWDCFDFITKMQERESEIIKIVGRKRGGGHCMTYSITHDDVYF
ncbi:arginine deiminase [Yersinia frederiksenii]|nr:arginine deiminase [Yersinia frederiksenii]